MRSTRASPSTAPLLNAGIDKAEHADRVASAFRRVHLPDLERCLDRYPHPLSGGQLSASCSREPSS